MKAKLIILGCGNSVGIPRIDGYWGMCRKNNKKNIRTRCSALILKGSNFVLIDTSPDIRNQFNNNNIKKLSSIIFTHEHADQTNGLFEIRPFFWKNKKKINIYGNLKTINHLKKRFDYCFNSIPGYPAIVQPNLIKKKFTLGKNAEKITFRTFQAKHGYTKTTIYIFEKLAYISDCNDLSVVNIKLLKNLKYLVLDCLRIPRSPVHFNLDDALYVCRHLKPKKTILTNLHPSLDYNLLLKKLPKNVIPAYDGLKLNL
jgi:phosphoribosyl 1,2-cyclic phosphate phosphodiesterase